MASASVRVALRVRPLSTDEQLNGEVECVTQLPGVPQIVIGADRAFTFDYVYSPEVTQECIYDDSIRPLVTQFLQGYNATVLAYGQTGSGKTYSMGTGLSDSFCSTETKGVVPRAIDEIWQHLQGKKNEDNGFSFKIEVTFLELYNEDLIDLLSQRSSTTTEFYPNIGGGGGRGPSIREDSHGNMVLTGVERMPAESIKDVYEFLHQGTLLRTTASTDMNHTSSRSHAIFTVFLRQQSYKSPSMRSSSKKCDINDSNHYMHNANELSSGHSIVSKIHFVDLAGSERIKRTGAAGARAREGISINAGLLALGNVISALGNSKSPKNNGASPSSLAANKRQTHVPYRDSKLTRLLQDSLGGNSQTLMLACISPSEKNHSESLNTIRYANRTRNIKNKVAVNFDKNSSVELNMLKTEVTRLRGELAKLQNTRLRSSVISLDNGIGAAVQLEAEISRLEAANSDLSSRLEHALCRSAVLERERNTLRVRVIELGGSSPGVPKAIATPVDIDSSQTQSSVTDTTEHPDQSDDSETRTQSPFAERSQRPNSIFTDGDMLTTMNHELSEQAERHEQQIDSVRRHYESKVKFLQESLSLAQKERDVALQRLANATKSSSSIPIQKQSAISPVAPGNTLGKRNGLGLGSPSIQNTPTKLRRPSKSSVSFHRDFSGTSSLQNPHIQTSIDSLQQPQQQLEASGIWRSSNDKNQSRAPSLSSPPHLNNDQLAIKNLRAQVEKLKSEIKTSAEKSAQENEKLAQQIQDQVKEISALRKKTIGQNNSKRDSHRYLPLPPKDNKYWKIARYTSEMYGKGEEKQNILRAAFIKKVLEAELQRCVQARRMLRERDRYLQKQDELMADQNDLLLQLQMFDGCTREDMGMSSRSSTGSERGSPDSTLAMISNARAQQANDRIEIIDAELHYLDLKVRDIEAEVAKLAEPNQTDSSDLGISGLLATPNIINMSGLAMRMVEDVVCIDYSAFAELFGKMSLNDVTGLAYLFIQDIISLRLVAHRDENIRKDLEEQIMDLRRTLLVMQKTALNAALSYEHELGVAERKIVTMMSPDLKAINQGISFTTAVTNEGVNNASQSPLPTSGLPLEEKGENEASEESAAVETGDKLSGKSDKESVDKCDTDKADRPTSGYTAQLPKSSGSGYASVSAAPSHKSSVDVLDSAVVSVDNIPHELLTGLADDINSDSTRSVYEGVRERGILLRSAMISTNEIATGSFSSSSPSHSLISSPLMHQAATYFSDDSTSASHSVEHVLFRSSSNKSQPEGSEHGSDDTTASNEEIDLSVSSEKMTRSAIEDTLYNKLVRSETDQSDTQSEGSILTHDELVIQPEGDQQTAIGVTASVQDSLAQGGSLSQLEPDLLTETEQSVDNIDGSNGAIFNERTSANDQAECASINGQVESAFASDQAENISADDQVMCDSPNSIVKHQLKSIQSANSNNALDTHSLRSTFVRAKKSTTSNNRNEDDESITSGAELSREEKRKSELQDAATTAEALFKTLKNHNSSRDFDTNNLTDFAESRPGSSLSDSKLVVSNKKATSPLFDSRLCLIESKTSNNHARHTFFSDPEDEGSIKSLHSNNYSPKRSNDVLTSGIQSVPEKPRKRYLVRRPYAKSRNNSSVSECANTTDPTQLLDDDRTRRSKKWRKGICKTRISNPIVPPDMLVYIENQNPNALSLNNKPIQTASPELVKKMNLVSANVCENNNLLPLFQPCQNHPAQSATTLSSESSEDISLTSDSSSDYGGTGVEVISDRRAIRRIASIRSSDDSGCDTENIKKAEINNDTGSASKLPRLRLMGVRSAASSNYSLYHYHRHHAEPTPSSSIASSDAENIIPPDTHQMQIQQSTLLSGTKSNWYSAQAHRGNNRMSTYTAIALNGESENGIFSTTEYDVRAANELRLNSFSNTNRYANTSVGPLAAATPTKPPAVDGGYRSNTRTSGDRYNSLHLCEMSSEDTWYNKERKQLSPTELANASFFSVLDAAKSKQNDSKLLAMADADTKISNIRSNMFEQNGPSCEQSKYNTCASHDLQVEELESFVQMDPEKMKLLKLRRRAYTAESQGNQKKSGFGIRVTKLLTEIGIGIGKAKDHSLALLDSSPETPNNGSMARDRSWSDTTTQPRGNMVARGIDSATNIPQMKRHGSKIAVTPLLKSNKSPELNTVPYTTTVQNNKTKQPSIGTQGSPQGNKLRFTGLRTSWNKGHNHQ